LDEAFLDVSNCPYCKGSATLIAKMIKNRIKKELILTASAGVAPNKFLAKVASAWDKPDGLFVITPTQIPDFVKTLPITKIFGVGKVTAKKLHNLQIKTCADLQKISLEQLSKQFGKIGERFYQFCRGIDDRPVMPDTIQKSLSIEETFPKDLQTLDSGLIALTSLIQKLKTRLKHSSNPQITKQFIKIKFFDFKKISAEITNNTFSEEIFFDLFKKGFKRYNKPIRLLGAGVRFDCNPKTDKQAL
ncbi:MAG: DNA polymerase IV, partial [Gammaproteobacteria bacterium]|nr:DNA polymerase IV [Gammaproteobacteria bacterium]